MNPSSAVENGRKMIFASELEDIVFLLMYLCKIEPVFNRICLEELQKMHRFSFHGKGNKEVAQPVHLDWLSLKP